MRAQNWSALSRTSFTATAWAPSTTPLATSGRSPLTSKTSHRKKCSNAQRKHSSKPSSAKSSLGPRLVRAESSLKLRARGRATYLNTCHPERREGPALCQERLRPRFIPLSCRPERAEAHEVEGPRASCYNLQTSPI